MSILIKNGNLIITEDTRCKDTELLYLVLDMRLKFPIYMDFFLLEINQYICKKFPHYLIDFRGERSNRLRVENSISPTSVYKKLDDKFIYNNGLNYTEDFYNIFLLEVFQSRGFIIGNDTKGDPPSYLGFKLVEDNDLYKFIELDCYHCHEYKKNFKWWE